MILRWTMVTEGSTLLTWEYAVSKRADGIPVASVTSRQALH